MRQIDVHKLADEATFNGFHALVLCWCALIIIFDGYDLAVAGIALPSIMKDMGVEPTQAGFMVSSALFGMMFGAIHAAAAVSLADENFSNRKFFGLTPTFAIHLRTPSTIGGGPQT